MSLLLNGSKTMTIAGTVMQCLEIYTGESYTLPFTFTYANTNPINCTGWTLSTNTKFYTVDTVTYPTADSVDLGNLTLNTIQPNANAYTISTAFTTAASGVGYLYIGNNITNTANVGIPQITLANNTANSTLVIVSLGVSRTDALSSLTDFNKEPIGIIVRYQ
jgi:hypothetical protein